jgi:large subunit ribosomal protein L15
VSEAPNLSSLKPAQARRDRKRVGRGMGSGKGRYSGRGIKGQKARAGSNKMRAGFEGGQMPIHMRVGKQRGATSKDAMPIGPHRTHTIPVNIRDLERVFADGDTVSIEALVEKGLVKSTKWDVKVLGSGELTKSLSVTAHRFSASARDKITAAGGTATALREVSARPPRRARERGQRAASETTAGAKGAAGEPDDAVDAEPQGAALAAEGEG